MRLTLAYYMLAIFVFLCDHVFSLNSTFVKLDYSYVDNSSSLEVSGSQSELTTNLSTVLKMATPCETPNHDPGYCINLDMCAKLHRQLNNSNAEAFLRESMCGPENEDKSNPKICCGKYNNFRKPTIVVEDNKIFPKHCGTQKIIMRGRIIGGKQAVLGEFPWMARLIHRNRYGYKTYGCSGFLIHVKFVLTAAHCIKSDRSVITGPVYAVVLGEHNSETKRDCSPGGTYCADPLQISRVSRVIVHPEYDLNSKAHYNDIALIYLNKGARMTDYVRPICLLHDSTQVPLKYVVSGWGRTETENESKIKMRVEIPPFDKISCIDKWSLLNIELSESQLCAGALKGKDSCTGDSGGPLMMSINGTTWFAAGLVSYGLGCGVEGWPGIYTNIPSFIPWIKHQIIENILVTPKNKKSLARKQHKGSPRIQK